MNSTVYHIIHLIKDNGVYTASNWVNKLCINKRKATKKSIRNTFKLFFHKNIERFLA